MGKAKELTKENFDESISKGVTLVDFWAEWCQPCKMIAPIVEDLVDEFKEKATIAKLDTDEHGEIAMKYGVQGIPTLILFKDGQPVDRSVGVVPKVVLQDLVNRHL